MKMLKKSEVIRLQQVEHVIQERSILACLSHPFIVRLVASFQGERYSITQDCVYVKTDGHKIAELCLHRVILRP
jgi:hypothetical protein